MGVIFRRHVLVRHPDKPGLWVIWDRERGVYVLSVNRRNGWAPIKEFDNPQTARNWLLRYRRAFLEVPMIWSL